MNPDEKINLRIQDVFVEPTFLKGPWLSGYKGIKKIDNNSSDYILVACDLPFLEANTITAFIQEIKNNKDADILIPLIPREINEKKFPDRRRTYQPLQEGDFLAGNIGYISQRALKQNENLVEEIASFYQKKLKFIFKAITYLGLSSVLKSNHPKLPLIKHLPLYEKFFPKFSKKELEERLSEFTNVNVCLIEFPYPESAFDIDNIEQFKLANDLYKSKFDFKKRIQTAPI